MLPVNPYTKETFVLNSCDLDTNRNYCNSQREALKNRLPVLITPIGWKEFNTNVFAVNLWCTEPQFQSYLTTYMYSKTWRVPISHV